MASFDFTYEKIHTLGAHDRAYVLDGEDPQTVLGETVMQDLSRDIWVTVGGVRNHLAAWQDPAHWGDDWAEVAGVDYNTDDDFDPEIYVETVFAAALAEVAP